MTDSSSERALLAILALESEEGSLLDNGARAVATTPLPGLDARAEMYMRAMREDDSAAGDPAQAREAILAAMAEDLADRSAQNGEGGVSPAPFAPPASPFGRARRKSRLGLRASASPWPQQRFIRRASAFAASTAALMIVGWSGAWLFALHSLDTTVTEWREWEGKSGRQYSCATESFGGNPFQVEMICGGPKAAITTGNSTFSAEAKQLRVAVNLLHPSVIVSQIEGPVSFAELGQPGSFEGRWSHAEATVTGPKPTPDGLSIAVADFKLDRVENGGTEPLASARHAAFHARLDPAATAATQRAAYDLTSDITEGSLPSGPPLAARPFEARMKAVLHGAGDMTPKPLPERIKGWQRNGGLVEMTSIEIRASATNANAQGTIALSEHGGIEGLLELSAANYDGLLEGLTGKTSASGPAGPATPQDKTNAQIKSRALPALRFVNGAAYFGSTPLGRLPALF